MQSAPAPQFTGAGFLGRGVQVESVRRSYNSFLDAQLREATAQAAHLDRYHDQVSQIDNLLADPATGLTPALSGFFAGVNTAAANPGDAPARQVLLSAGQSLAGRFRDLAARLDQMRQGANTEINATVVEINTQSAKVAQLNDQIRLAQGSGQPPNDLLDQRDALLRDLAGNIRINVIPLTDGTLNAFLPNGQALVLGSQSLALSVAADPANAANLTIGIGAGSNFRPMRESDLPVAISAACWHFAPRRSMAQKTRWAVLPPG